MLINDSEKRASSNKLVETALSCSLDKEIDNYSKNVRILNISELYLKDGNGKFLAQFRKNKFYKKKTLI